MRLLFYSGAEFAIATHDDKLIRKAVEYNETKRKGEFQMLMGIRDKLKTDLTQEGHRVSVYIPYGKEWIREKPSNILLAFRSIFQK